MWVAIAAAAAPAMTASRFTAELEYVAFPSAAPPAVELEGLEAPAAAAPGVELKERAILAAAAPAMAGSHAAAE